MKQYKNILVFENDLRLSFLAEEVLKNENVPFEPWYNFNYSFIPTRIDESFDKLKTLSEDTICFANPSFVGSDNHFQSYFYLLKQFKDNNIKLDLVIIYPEGLLTKILDFVSHEQKATKKSVLLAYMEELLTFHNIYEIPYSANKFEFKISNAVHITWESFKSLYVETHRLLAQDKFEDPNGNIYPVYTVYYHTGEEPEITLYDPNDYNNKYKLSQLKRV